jgi:hypothetical protein
LNSLYCDYDDLDALYNSTGILSGESSSVLEERETRFCL